MKKVIWFLGLMISTSLFAFREGGMGSGGGSGVVCFNSIENTQKVRESGGIVPDQLIKNVMGLLVMDMQLAYMRGGLGGAKPRLYLAHKDQTYQEFFEVLLTRLDVLYPDLAKRVRDASSHLVHNIYFRINPIKRIIDENDVGLEESDYCTVVNIAAQYQVDGETFIHIDERLFNHPKHSESSKAVLLLHEFIYSELRLDGAVDSRKVRKIVQRILENP